MDFKKWVLGLKKLRNIALDHCGIATNKKRVVITNITILINKIKELFKHTCKSQIKTEDKTNFIIDKG